MENLESQAGSFNLEKENRARGKIEGAAATESFWEEEFLTAKEKTRKREWRLEQKEQQRRNKENPRRKQKALSRERWLRKL
mgnify:CR=1 FL=1